MMPQGRSLRFYECVEFPMKWVRHSEHLQGMPIQDITIVKYQGKWWAFGMYEPGRNPMQHFLHIYYASNPFGPWLPTANNCVLAGGGNITCAVSTTNTPHHQARAVRSGGHMLVDNGWLYRLVQDSYKFYGDTMNLYKVTRLTTTEPIEEHIIPEFSQNFLAKHNLHTWNKLRHHHVDLHRVPGREGQDKAWVALVDGDCNMGRNNVGPQPLPEDEIRCQDLQ